MIRLRSALARTRGDDGAALATVLGLSLVMLVLIAIGASITVSGIRKSSTDTAWNGALAAAYAGVDEYKSRLADDPDYIKYGNPAAPFTVASGSASTVSLPTASLNPAFGVTAGGTWASVPGAGNRSQFRYEVDNTTYARTGVLRLRSTGKVGDVTRSIVANVKQQGFIDFVYYTDYEVIDPQWDTDCDPGYEWAGDRGSGCESILFTDDDVLDGPVHSNDTMRVCRSQFLQAVTTLKPTAPYYDNNGCGSATFGDGITGGVSVQMPTTNAAMREEAVCTYTGPTQIVFNAGGTMTVVSPWTRNTLARGGASCGAVGTGTGQLGNPGGATVAVPDHDLIFVQDVPPRSDTTNPNRPNGTSSTVTPPTNVTCTTGSSGGWRLTSGSATVRYPLSSESEAEYSSSTTPAYDCDRGDVFVRGAMNGALTIAATTIYVTGDIAYQNTSSNVLGLVGQSAVWVWNPMNGSSPMNPNGTGNRRIDAAIISVAHSFQVQNHDRGGRRGILTVNGSIAQKFRGVVGTGSGSSTSNGYEKKYVYDQRFISMAPPKFLSPIATVFRVSQYSTVATAFNPDGSPR
ncbi:hypothetical protein [Agromyces seonyuensis]|uniref:Uncharacterized protein n=1 Tax=Agromyces seonyuensis TaxID=2662446 RepID=A0A6I4NZL1_9MICO|nr:hypothetical protein [Agromyces seonyuensis]MWB99591.1 hypothetical protein [Agromyces seonyuensis]